MIQSVRLLELTRGGAHERTRRRIRSRMTTERPRRQARLEWNVPEDNRSGLRHETIADASL